MVAERPLGFSTFRPQNSDEAYQLSVQYTNTMAQNLNMVTLTI